MKKIILLLFFAKILNAQVIPQCDATSCWAASMAMVSKKIDLFPKMQTQFISMNGGSFDSLGKCKSLKIGVWPYFQMVKENLYGYTNLNFRSMGLNYIKQTLTKNKPIIYNYNLDGSASHIVIIDTVLSTDYDSLKSISFLKIKDPWPEGKGNEYYMTYERYYAQNQGNIPDSTNDLRQPDKYTISFSENCNSNENDGIKDIDKDYLNKIIYDSTSVGVIDKFLVDLKENKLNLSSDFIKNTGLKPGLTLNYTINKEFMVLYVSKATYINDSLKIETLLNHQFSEKISVISYNDSIKTIISTSNKVPPSGSTYPFYGNWIIYHIENGASFEDALFLANSDGFSTDILNNTGLIIRCLDSIFLVTKKDSQYYVYPIYENVYNKLTYNIGNHGINANFRGFFEGEIFFKLLIRQLNNQ